MTLGTRIQALREARGWSRLELARQAHIPQRLITALESGAKRDTTGAVLIRLARTLGVSLDYLVGLYDGYEAKALRLRRLVQLVGDAAEDD